MEEWLETVLRSDRPLESADRHSYLCTGSSAIVQQEVSAKKPSVSQRGIKGGVTAEELASGCDPRGDPSVICQRFS